MSSWRKRLKSFNPGSDFACVFFEMNDSDIANRQSNQGID